MAPFNKHRNKNSQNLINNPDVEKSINSMELARGYSV